MLRSIIFDLGNVLVNVEYERFRNKLFASGVTPETYNNFFTGGNYRLLGYESGDISTDEFVDRCLKGLSLNMTREDFSYAFNDMFSEIRGMSALVRKLADEKKYNLFLLSNTSPLHFEYIMKNYDYVNMLDKYALSYKLKSLKPQAEIYERTVGYLNIIPEESLFIDDLPENCEAAEKFGIKTIKYDRENHQDFLDIFSDLTK